MAANTALLSALENEGPFDLIYERYSLWSFAGMSYAREAGVPGVLEVNAPLIEEQAEHRGLVDRLAATRIAEKVFHEATVLVAVSNEIKAYLEQFSTARERVHTIPNGVNPDRFLPGLRQARRSSPDKFTVGFIGTLKPWHGLATLVDAFAIPRSRDTSLRLLIVGDGPELSRLVHQVAERGLGSSVDWVGAVGPEKIPDWLAAMDVAVAPYPNLQRFYFSPLKVLEYMAAGLPVIASRIGQIEELIEHGATGWLVPPGDVSALATALLQLRATPVSARERLGAAARRHVLTHHTWDAVAQRILELADNSTHARPLSSRLATLNSRTRDQNEHETMLKLKG